MTGAAERSERWERSLPSAGVPSMAAALIGRAAAAGVQLQARPGGRLWADRPDLLPSELRADLAAHRPAVLHALGLADAKREPPAPPPGNPPLAARGALGGAPTPPAPLPGVPLSWCEGVARLASLPAPATVPPARWAALAATSHRLLHDHGAALHGAGWGTLDVWGLHAHAPACNPAGWGLAWLLDAHGDVLDVGPDVVGMRRAPDGARLAFRQRAGCKRVPVWELGGAGQP